MKTSDIRILSIDDDLDYNRLLERRFNKHGIAIHTTTQVADFVSELKQNPPSLCLIDVNLSEGLSSGLSLVQAIRNVRGPDLPIFVVSSRNSSEDVLHAIEIGANDYISKPLDFDFLLSKIDEHLRLSDSSIPTFPFKRIPTSEAHSLLWVDFHLHAVSEYGIVLRSKGHLSKGILAQIRLPDDFEIRGETPMGVSSVTIDPASGLFLTRLDFNPEDRELLDKVKRWISVKMALLEESTRSNS